MSGDGKGRDDGKADPRKTNRIALAVGLILVAAILRLYMKL
jgi:hypothetical protein